MSLSANSERFLNAFAVIENDMNRRIKSDRYISYAELVRRMATLDKSYHQLRRYLEEFGDLRNAIVHERIDGEVIAEPHLKVVEQIEHIAQLLTQPERVKPAFLKKVNYLYDDIPLKQAVTTLDSWRHSKIPVYDRKMNFKGLLTTDAVTHFLVKAIAQANCDFPEVSVDEVMKLDEKYRAVTFISENATLLSVINEFESHLRQGKKLYEIIITQNGSSNQKPLGIITTFDLPLIYDKINHKLLQ